VQCPQSHIHLLCRRSRTWVQLSCCCCCPDASGGSTAAREGGDVKGVRCALLYPPPSFSSGGLYCLFRGCMRSLARSLARSQEIEAGPLKPRERAINRSRAAEDGGRRTEKKLRPRNLPQKGQLMAGGAHRQLYTFTRHLLTL
jgi:hypothetical protein